MLEARGMPHINARTFGVLISRIIFRIVKHLCMLSRHPPNCITDSLPKVSSGILSNTQFFIKKQHMFSISYLCYFPSRVIFYSSPHLKGTTLFPDSHKIYRIDSFMIYSRGASDIWCLSSIRWYLSTSRTSVPAG